MFSPECRDRRNAVLEQCLRGDQPIKDIDEVIG
jgi:hypothetical protein